ncbi:MAG: Piwi domain-containing protein, partial [Candidatus Korobacteraceae bacterium]
PALASADKRIGVYPKILVDILFTKTAMNELVMGLVVDVVYTTRLDVSAEEWVAAGLGGQLPGKYVTLLPDSPEANLHPACVNKVVGQIGGIRGNVCVLLDLREPSLAQLPLTSVAPEPTRTNLNTYLSARWSRAYGVHAKSLANKLRELVRPESRHRLASALVHDRLQAADVERRLPILPEVFVKFGAMQNIGGEHFPARRFVEPEFSFDSAGDKYALRVDTGLKKHGPYDYHQQRSRSFRVLVVAPSENKGEVSIAIEKLLNGVRTQQDVFAGLKAMYRLPCLEVVSSYCEWASGAPMKRYAEAVTSAISQASDRVGVRSKFDLVLVVISSVHRKLPNSENPYLQTKALALVLDGTPTQAITIEKLRHKDYDLQYILNTISLACYAKLGGTSHVLRLPGIAPDGPTELVFGVGRALNRQGRFGRRYETIGFATVFRANGEYLYNDSTPYCDESAYERALEATVRRTVEKVAAFEQLSRGSALRLIFHVPRRPGQREATAILNAVGKLPEFAVEFALLHINDDHNVQLFDVGDLPQHSPINQKKNAGAQIPARGWSVYLGPRERLLTFIGPTQYRGQGTPAPLRITLDKRSTFLDIEYLSQQLFLMSFMNVGSLNPGAVPVTIAYAERLAHLTGNLRGVQQWTVDLIQTKLSRRLWFV